MSVKVQFQLPYLPISSFSFIFFYHVLNCFLTFSESEELAAQFWPNIGPAAGFQTSGPWLGGAWRLCRIQREHRWCGSQAIAMCT